MARLPSKDDLRNWIAENPGQTAKRDIARAFGLKGSARLDLKRLLRELEDEGAIAKRRRSYRDPEHLPPVTILSVSGPDGDGDLFARPLEWRGEGAMPRILVIPRQSDPALGAGDRILAKLNRVQGDGHEYEARLIRKIGTNPQRLLGIFRKGTEGGRIVPIDKGADREWMVPAGAMLDARDGELVEAERMGAGPRMGLPRARVLDRLGDPSAPRAVSLIAIHQHGIPDAFSDDAIAEADAAADIGPEGREDLREMPFVTIDPSDARDHDDAVYAQPDESADNPGGHVVWVAIADVAAYVRAGSALDRDARERGNSTYFPDRVVPMLPDRLSGELCSLHEGVDRPVIAVRMVLDKDGRKIAHRFTRGVIRSAASLAYEAVQAAVDGDGTAIDPQLFADVIAPLHAAWKATMRARAAREPLDIDLPERRIVLSDDGRVTSVAFKERLDAHRVIEEFMILANVAAAEELIEHKSPVLFRVHEEPSPEKLDALREVAVASGMTLAKGQVLRTSHLNRLLAQAEGSEFDELINMSTLRAMTQAYYSPQNFGHFGLALRNYAHFTSPIRRYADLVVHRALISAHRWGKDGLTPAEVDRLQATAQHVSETERRSMTAERDTTDRYLAAWLSERVGSEFAGRVSGITRFGLFVKLDETGADGLVPIRSLGAEYFHFDADAQTLMGDQSGLTIGLGARVLVRLAEAVPVTGGVMLELLELDGNPLPRGAQNGGRGKKGHGRGGRKPGPARRKAEKVARKVSRRRG